MNPVFPMAEGLCVSWAMSKVVVWSCNVKIIQNGMAPVLNNFLKYVTVCVLGSYECLKIAEREWP